MIKFLIAVLILAAALYFWKRYREAKRRELAERDADAWLNFYAGYTGGSWGTGTGIRRPQISNNSEIGILHRIESSGTNNTAAESGTKRTGGGYSVTREKRIF
jgi:hypothetical protein